MNWRSLFGLAKAPVAPSEDLRAAVFKANPLVVQGQGGQPAEPRQQHAEGRLDAIYRTLQQAGPGEISAAHMQEFRNEVLEHSQLLRQMGDHDAGDFALETFERLARRYNGSR